MNRSEQKERLGDIIQLAQDTVKSLEQKKEDLQWIFNKMEGLKDSISDFLGNENVVDFDEVRETIVNQFFESELDDLHTMTDEFQDELNDYIEELSEARAERLEEKYTDLEDVVSSFDQSEQEYEDIETAIEHIEESINFLKDMKK